MICSMTTRPNDGRALLVQQRGTHGALDAYFVATRQPSERLQGRRGIVVRPDPSRSREQSREIAELKCRMTSRARDGRGRPWARRQRVIREVLAGFARTPSLPSSPNSAPPLGDGGCLAAGHGRIRLPSGLTHGRGAVRVRVRVQPHGVDHDQVVERAEQDQLGEPGAAAFAPRGRCRWTWQAAGGWWQPGAAQWRSRQGPWARRRWWGWCRRPAPRSRGRRLGRGGAGQGPGTQQRGDLPWPGQATRRRWPGSGSDRLAVRRGVVLGAEELRGELVEQVLVHAPGHDRHRRWDRTGHRVKLPAGRDRRAPSLAAMRNFAGPGVRCRSGPGPRRASCPG